jgi:sulfite exporter TauE/SafE
VALIGLLSLVLRDFLPVDLLSTWGERLVGVMLFGVGLWALRTALKVHAHEHEHDGQRHIHLHTHAHRVAHERAEAHEHTHAAFGIGVLHGLAGSSHFLGVLPILAFPTQPEAIAYLITFGAGTIVSMAAFSWVMGFVATRWAARSAKVYRGLMSCCAIMAMAMGCAWLVMSWR